MNMKLLVERPWLGASCLGLVFAVSTGACSFDDRNVRVRPGLGNGDGDMVGDGDIIGDGDVVGDGDIIGDGDGDVVESPSLDEACDYALTALSTLFTACLGDTFTYADCSGADDTDIDALVLCGDEVYASSCDTLSGQTPSETPTCDVLVDDATIYFEFASAEE